MITVGEIVAAHGLSGQVRIVLHTDFPERFSQMESIWVTRPNGERARRKILDVSAHSTKPLLILKLDGIWTRDTATAFVGSMLEIDDDEAMPLPEGVYYEHDLIGLQVFTTDGWDLGPLTEVLRTGANDVYVTPTCLIPAIPQVVREVNLDQRRMVVEPIPGMIDEDE